MKTLIVPDVHERYSQLLKIEEKYFADVDRVVMLGDFFDSFGHDINLVKLIATWILGHVFDPKFTFLFGNHDHHYAFKRTGFSSGYQEDTQRLLNEEFSSEIWRKFKIWTEVGPYLVSHAGFNKHTFYLKDEEEKAINAAFSGIKHPMWDAGFSVGGIVPWGGPTWLRWWELDDVGQKQIVGHTAHKEPQTDINGNVCLDTNLKHIAIYDDETEELNIEAI